MEATTSPESTFSSEQARLINWLTRIWPWLFLTGLIVFFTVAGGIREVNFLSIRNFSSILVTSTLIMLLAVGQTFVIITAGIDLSIGWTTGLASVVCALVVKALGAEPGTEVIALVGGVVVGLAASLVPGVVNGVLVARINVPPFIATLGMFGIVRGAAFLLTTGKNVVGDLPANARELLRSIGNGSLVYDVPGRGLVFFEQPPDLTPEQLRGLDKLAPYPVLITVAVVIVFAFVLARTVFGRHTYAIGGSKEAALRSGINVTRHLIVIYVLSSLTAGIAGVLHVFRYTAGAPNAGEAQLLDSVAAVVIGGTDLFGGKGSIIGSVVGALIIAVLQTGLVMLNVDSLWRFIVVGCVIIVAVLVNQLQERLEKQQEHHE